MIKRLALVSVYIVFHKIKIKIIARNGLFTDGKN